jgi:hypothetical protein
MPTIICTLGTDPADAALNRPALVLRPAEREEALPLAQQGTAPLLATLLGADGTRRRTFGASEFPALRAELQAALIAIDAARLPDRLILALTLQRLDTTCRTAQELGLNLYVRIENDTNDE